MVLAWSILMRATRDITDNITVALQLSLVPLVLFQFVGVHWLTQADAMQQGFLFVSGRFVWWMWALGLAGLILPMLWLAVGWHRFVVLGEQPWLIFPRVRLRQIVGYAWVSVLALLLTGLIAIVLSFVISFAVGIVVAILRVADVTSYKGFGFEAVVLGAFIFNAVFFRYCPAVVGVAVDGPRGLQQAWTATVPARRAVLWLALLVAGLGWAFERIAQAMVATGFVLSGYELVSTWFLTMLNIGLLTTVYAMFLHGAPLPSSTPEGTAPE